MTCSRRRALHLSSVALATGVAGCNPLSSPSDDRPDEQQFITSRDVSMRSSECLGDESRPHLATASYDASASRLTINGRINAASPCPRISLAAERGDGTDASEDAPVHIGVDPSETGGCEPCRAAVRYGATVEFASDPPEIVVYHLEETDDGWQRSEPVATTTP